MTRTHLYALIAVLLLALLTPASLLAGPQEPQAAPPAPTYLNDFADCVTGDNQFYNSGIQKFRWYINQAVGANGSTSPNKCDSYQNDQYERPTSQTFVYGTISEKPPYTPPPTPSSPTYLSGLLADGEFGVGQTVYSTDAGLYHEYVDITRARAGHDVGWMFFRIELFGDYEVDSAGSRTYKFGDGTYYTVRLGNVNATPNQKANGGIILRNQWETSQPSSWSADSSKVKIFVDTNYDVSGYQGVNFTKDDGDTMPPQDGYDLDRQNNGYLYVRKVTESFTGPGGTVSRPVVEFAFNYAAYNQAFNADFTPFTLTYLEFDATRGLKDNQNYLWNDEYTLNEAGSPNPHPNGPNPGNLGQAGTSGTGNIYELDTLRGDGLFGKGSIGNCVWHDDDRDQNGPPGCTKGPDYDAGEQTFPGVPVNLVKVTGPNTIEFVGMTTTDTNGKYLFTGLDAGTYIVDDLESAVFSYFGGPFMHTTPEPYTYALAQGENHVNADFGYDRELGAVYVGDWVWYDKNNNGQQDDGAILFTSPTGTVRDTGIPCVEVRLYEGPTGAIDVSQVTQIGVVNTDSYGTYAFPLMLPNAAGRSYYTSVGIGVDQDIDVTPFIQYYDGARTDTTCNLATAYVNPAFVYPTVRGSTDQMRSPEGILAVSLQDTSLPNANTFDLTLDFPFTSAPLAVTLADFRAEAQADSVLVSWETVSELDNTGFNLYRSLAADGEFTLLAYLPSQAPSGMVGASYSYQDVDVQAGQTYWYRLEAIDLNGAATLFGPVSVTFQSPTAVTLSSIEASPAAASSLPLAGVLLALLLVPVGVAWVRRRA